MMVFCKDCKHFRCCKNYYNLFSGYFYYNERCVLEKKVDYISHPIEGIKKEVAYKRSPFSKNKDCDCPDYKAIWWKALFMAFSKK